MEYEVEIGDIPESSRQEFEAEMRMGSKRMGVEEERYLLDSDGDKFKNMSEKDVEKLISEIESSKEYIFEIFKENPDIGLAELISKLHTVPEVMTLILMVMQTGMSFDEANEIISTVMSVDSRWLKIYRDYESSLDK